MKRCGKSTPAILVTISAWKTPLEARPSRDDIVVKNKKQSLASHQGWLLELKSDLKSRQMIGLKDRTRLIVYLANLLTV